jgi:hypothetical protein
MCLGGRITVNATSYTRAAKSFLSFVTVWFLLGLSLYSYRAQELAGYSSA